LQIVLGRGQPAQNAQLSAAER